MRRKNGASTLLLLLLILGAAGAFVAIHPKQSVPQPNEEKAPPTAFGSLSPKTSDTDEHNPDGTMKLIMHTEVQPDGSVIYSFFIADINGGSKKLIFTKTEPKDIPMAIHHNSFSPDNKLVLVEEHGTTVKYLVLKVSGDPFANGSQFLDINTLYTERSITYHFNDVTGWAGPTLAIVTTKKDDGTLGPKFWFVTDSRAFLQLVR